MLQVLHVGLYPGIGQFLRLIPSDSVSFIRVSNYFGIGDCPTTYSDSWPWESLGEFERRSYIEDDQLAEFTHLCDSIRKIAKRFSARHPGSKTRVQATLGLTESEIRAVENGETPLYKARLEEELGDCVDFELILIHEPYYEHRVELQSDGTYLSHFVPVS